MNQPPRILWAPPPDVRRTSVIGHYLSWLESELDLRFADYDELWRWSVDDLPAFWSSIWRFFTVEASTPYDAVLAGTAMPGARWFPGARLNYAARALATTGAGTAVVARSQSHGPRQLSWDDLRDQVARCRFGLARLGVGSGDRVVGYLPNGPEAVIALLAAASLGAVWASCPPEFGARSVIDRFGQLDPAVLLVSRGIGTGARTWTAAPRWTRSWPPCRRSPPSSTSTTAGPS